ncbi:class I SAM-dependent methyltransferase (plasmid) [Acidithiobacillus ferrooxidans]|nr:class I SAM-dependent methyltransferase [Acidithiobacillus ferrooxidans]
MNNTDNLPLSAIFKAHTDNLSDKWEQYFQIYEAELGHLRSSGSPVRLLEIGVQNGGFLQIWKKYLPVGSQIFGFDVDPKCASLRMPSGIEIFIGDASDPATLEDRLGPLTFDIIVDDGSHRCDHVVATFNACFPRLKPEGIYIVEDLHCSYYPSHEGGLCKAGSSVEFFKSLADALHSDYIMPDDMNWLPPHMAALGREIARVTFYDSIVAIARLPEGKTRPFARILTGGKAPVLDPSPYLPHLPLSQLRNLTLAPSADAVFGHALRAGLVALREELDAARAQAEAREADIAGKLRCAEQKAVELASLREELDAARAQAEAREADIAGKLRCAEQKAVELASLREELDAARAQAEAREADIAGKLRCAEQKAVELASLREELDAARAQAEAREADIAGKLRCAEQKAVELASLLDTTRAQAQAEIVQAYRERDALLASTMWKSTWPLRWVASRMPKRFRVILRRFAKIIWWSLTFKLFDRLRERQRTGGTAIAAFGAQRFLSSHEPPSAPAAIPQEYTEYVQGEASVAEIIAERFPSLRPFSLFLVPRNLPRLSIVTDSVGPSSLFGGVGTSLIFGAQLANRLGTTLRVITRTEPADAAPIADVLASSGTTLHTGLELAMSPINGSKDLDVVPDELFLSTSWWTTRAALSAVDPSRIIALVQEDERMFYPQSDERLLCAETLNHPDILTVVNTEGLFRHLTQGPAALANLARKGMYFEPAFPVINDALLRPAYSSRKRRLFFYARPQNLRNLFWRGIEAIDEATAQGIFPADRWELYWVGKDLPRVRLGSGIVPIYKTPMALGEYKDFISTMDAGFVLMDTPHPSYPPLDLAATGAAVLTNTHPGKEDLTHYSHNILTAELSRDALVDGLRRLAMLSEDDAARARNHAADHILRDWETALRPVVDRLAIHLAS